ncbi:MAG: hypothetical protein IH892_08855, partial [Planctomycetes bacterium]|nr:hypothetical protein [Planctomycetota bacterium]
DGTYNVQKFESSPDGVLVGLEMYGTQEVKVKLLFEPHEVTSNNADLKIKGWRYEAPFISMAIHGQNMQGETGMVSIKGFSTGQ